MDYNSKRHIVTNIVQMDNIFKHSNLFSFINFIIYIDFDNVIRKLKSTYEMYKNIPSLRTKLVINQKSYRTIKTSIEILDEINEQLLKFNHKVKEFYVITNDKDIVEHIKRKNLNIKNMSHEQFMMIDFEKNK